jgi:hypothetical protein
MRAAFTRPITPTGSMQDCSGWQPYIQTQNMPIFQITAINTPISSYTIYIPYFLFTKNQIKLLLIFYKSTLMLSVASSMMLAVLSFMQPMFMLFVFGACFLSAGTVITLLYKETSRQHEYYFYYNMGLSRQSLMLTCILGNLFVGILFISLYIYAQHS